MTELLPAIWLLFGAVIGACLVCLLPSRQFYPNQDMPPADMMIASKPWYSHETVQALVDYINVGGMK